MDLSFGRCARPPSARSGIIIGTISGSSSRRAAAAAAVQNKQQQNQPSNMFKRSFGAGYTRAGAKDRQGVTEAPAAQNMSHAAQAAALEEAAALASQLQEKEALLQQMSAALAAAEDELLATTQQQQQQQQQEQQQQQHGGSKQSLLDAAQVGQPGADVHWLLLAGGTDQQRGADGADEGGDGLKAARWRSLAARRAELTLRWQCLLEDKKRLANKLQQTRAVGDFEPGETPMRDVTCAVITHQLDVPCFSCCFQR